MSPRYLVYAVHGRRAARAPRRRSTSRGPARNAAYRAWIRTCPCLVCNCHPSEAAHTGSDGGMRLKASDYSCLPICTEHHTMAPDSYHRHPGGRKGFEAWHNLNLDQLVEFFNLEWREKR